MFSDQRMKGYEESPLIIKGISCELVRNYIPPIKKFDTNINIAIINKNREVWEADPGYVKKCNPKYIQFQDGHKERYNPSKHF